MSQALTVEQLFDSVAIRVDGPRAWAERLAIDWVFTDLDTPYRMTLSNGALIHWANPAPGGTDLTLTLTKPQLLGMLAGNGLEGIRHRATRGRCTGSSACSIPPIPGSRSSHPDGAAAMAAQKSQVQRGLTGLAESE